MRFTSKQLYLRITKPIRRVTLKNKKLSNETIEVSSEKCLEVNTRDQIFLIAINNSEKQMFEAKNIETLNAVLISGF